MIHADDLPYVVLGVGLPFVGTVTLVKLWRGALPTPLVFLGLLCLFRGGRRR